MSFFQLKAKRIDGSDVSFSQFEGKVLLIVNTASKCGFTGQYEGLEKIYSIYKDKGFYVLGFPSADFGGQEFEKDSDTATFCESKFHTSFPLFAKVSVTGAKTPKHPVYEYLTEKHPNSALRITPKWNFGKFLVDKKGQVISYFESGVEPTDTKITQEIEKALKN